MSPSPAGTASVDVVDLRVEYERGPKNVEPEAPRFSWRAEAEGRDERQSAYRILVSRSRDALAEERGDCWDSGTVSRSTSTSVEYEGIPLESGTDYHWTVRIRDGDGRPSEWAEPATFSTAPTDVGEWEGRWIGYRPGGEDSNGYRSRWHPADGEAGENVEEWVQVDLGETREFERIALHPAAPYDAPKTPDGVSVSEIYAVGSDVGTDGNDDGDGGELERGAVGFGFPTVYRVEVADDPSFDDSRVVAEREVDLADLSGPATVALEGTESARYVRVTATECYEFDPAEPPAETDAQLKTEFLREERRAWRTFALAALAVRDADGADLARGASVAASSSVEEGGWGRERLVDGRYRSAAGPGSALLRTEVDLEREVVRARAHVCGLGYGELYVNGEKAGERVLDPGWTQYDERVLYSTYDVTDALAAGTNALGIHLGRGWFAKHVRDWTGFGAPRAICQLEVEYDDGTTRRISSDGSWRAASGPIVANDLYDGEVYDARLEEPGWAEPGFDDSDWESATAVEGPGGDLVPQRAPPIRVTETLEPVEIIEGEDGPIVDFGQNIVGWVDLEVAGASEGDEISIRHAETLLEDGSLAMEDLRSAEATDTYVAAGPERVSYHPRFTYHGFRYAQVIGYPGDLSADALRGRVVHSDLEPIGEFDCSNEDLSRIQQNARWGLRGNIHSVLTDCPQRDERFGWTGDNQIAARALMYNFDAALFYEKWMDDHADVRSEHGYVADTIPHGFGTVPEDPTWGITQVTIPWHLYRHYGDEGVLERHYEGMRRYVDYWFEESAEGIVPDEYGNYGDWLAFENAEGRRGLPFDLYNSAFHYHATNLFAKIAVVLGNEADAERYADRAERIAESFDEAFYDPDGERYGPGTQSSYAVPLFVGLVPEDREEAIADELAEAVRDAGGKLQTGFLGTRPLLHVLVEHGYADLAYEVASQPERPGWVYMVRQGATTVWERWDTDDRIGAGMNSFNHSPFTFVSEWFFEALAGLGFGEETDGLRSFELAPAAVDDLEWAGGSLETPVGELASRWERMEDGLALEVTVPWNATARVRSPIAGDAVTITEGGETVWDGGLEVSTPDGIRDAGLEEGRVVLVVGSGTYRFEITG